MKTSLQNSAGVLAGGATYGEPLQLTAKPRAAKGSEKQDVSSSEY